MIYLNLLVLLINNNKVDPYTKIQFLLLKLIILLQTTFKILQNPPSLNKFNRLRNHYLLKEKDLLHHKRIKYRKKIIFKYQKIIQSLILLKMTIKRK